ncbi:MAG: hypothetical protein HQM13_07600 [SAR324 cluster bacterium]|nr:hypothetical protein [SAR324 cluster bacterium]
MLNNFDPKEKKAMIIFFALLLLGIVYVYTHELPWDQNRLQSYEEQQNSDSSTRKSSPPKKSYDRML